MTEKGHKKTDLRNLPSSAAEFVKLVIQKMRYRKVVREEVQAELAGQFEDEIQNCPTDKEKEQKALELVDSFGDVKLLAVLLRRAKKRCRPLWRTAVVRAFQTVGVLILCFILYTVWFISGKPTVRVDYLAQLNKMGQPQISNEDNAWPHYERAIELYVQPSDELDGMPAYLDWKRPAYRSFETLSEQERQEIGKWIRQNKAAWQQFVAGSTRPYCYRGYTKGKNDPLLAVVLPHLATLRDLLTIGIFHSRMQIAQGQTAQALDDCLAVVLAGSHWQGWGTIIEQLVGLHISRVGYEEILYIAATEDISAADLKRLQQQLSRIYPRGYPLMDIEGERLVFLDMVQHTFTDGGPGGGHLIPKRLSFIDEIIGGGFDGMDGLVVGTAMGMIHARRNDTISKFNEIFDKQSEAAKMTPYERHAGKALHDEKIFLASSKYRYALVNLFMPAFGRACEYAYRGRALYEATVTVLALQRWRLEKGQYPMSLNELVAAGYIEKVPMDPYSDKPLVYKKTDDSFVLYSLGPDFDDDGGVENPEDSRKRRQEGPGDEVFWPVLKSEAKQEQYGRSI
ncbi:MAG: hypothetical protein ACYSUY_17360 [Planctomycetota bacterium]|jgi:hypothetical protein